MEQNTNTETPMMPVVDNKQKNSNGLKIATVIACVVAVCGIGFGVYGMIQSSTSNTEIENLKNKITEQEESTKAEQSISKQDELSEITTTDDITKESTKSYIPKKFDILCAGFPCQPFSIAGVSKKKSLGRETGFKDKTQGTLFFDVADIISRHRPKAFYLENVKNLVSHDKDIRGVKLQHPLPSNGRANICAATSRAHYDCWFRP